MKILIPTYSTFELINTNEIIAIQANDNNCKLILKGGKNIQSTKSLGKFADELFERGFCQCHKSFIVNIEKVIRYHKDGEAEMEDGSMIPVARRRREEFLERVCSNIDNRLLKEVGTTQNTQEF